MTLKYQIKMLSDWHVGSGLDGGAAADALVLKDKDGLPYISGKTMKGLLKDALLDMMDVGHCKQKDINHIFGYEVKNDRTYKGCAFFSNAILPKDEREEIVSHSLAEHLYRNIASTKIKKNGVAQDNSLRTMEVTQPLTLEAWISDIEEKDVVLLEKAFKWLRKLGVNRNRGLGRCQLITTEKL